MEVTQFTYFQQCGSLKVAPTAVEITYGLERIMMSLQGVKHFKDIRYNDTMTCGEMLLQNEYEMSVFNMDEADVPRTSSGSSSLTRRPTACSTPGCPSPRLISSSRRRTRSTSWTPAAPWASPSARSSSRA